MSGYVLLEDGARFDGELRGDGEWVTGEVVFNTAMTGYQESVTDPSYAGQIITFTYPLIGNYGVAAAAMESDRAQARGVIMREAKNAEDAADAEGGWLDWLRDCGVPAIDGVDTRALVRHIRDRGAMRGGIFPAELPDAEARGAGRGRAADERRRPGSRRNARRADRVGRRPGSAAAGPHVVGIDTGIKHSILRQLRERGLPDNPAAVRQLGQRRAGAGPGPGLPGQRPGRPRGARLRRRDGQRAGRQATRVRHLPRPPAPLPGGRASRPSSCPSATAAPTTRSRTWPRGGSRSPRRTTASRSSGPHGESRLEGDEPVRWETDFGAAELSHLNLYDRTVEGLVLQGRPGGAPSSTTPRRAPARTTPATCSTASWSWRPPDARA